MDNFKMTQLFYVAVIVKCSDCYIDYWLCHNK